MINYRQLWLILKELFTKIRYISYIMNLTIKCQAIRGQKTLQQIGRITTGLYNSASYHRQQVWKKTGKIPGYYEQYRIFQDNHLARLLYAQVAQQTLKEIDRAYRSWYVLRRKDSNARPPKFRKPKTPVSIWWTPNSFKIIDDKTIRFSIANLGTGRKFLSVRIIPDLRYKLKELNIKMINVVFNGDDVYACLCCQFQEPKLIEAKEIIALDLGIINLVASTDTKGKQEIISGRKLLSTQRYFNKKVASLQSQLKKDQRSTKAIRRLKRKSSRQIKHALHIASKHIIKEAKEKQACILVGDLTGLRKSKSKKIVVTETGEKIKKRKEALPFVIFAS